VGDGGECLNLAQPPFLSLGSTDAAHAHSGPLKDW
jgi:hypothetical protein